MRAQVYSVAAYVEADRCAKELGVRSRGGFFESDDDFTSALLDGAFNKALLVRRRGEWRVAGGCAPCALLGRRGAAGRRLELGRRRW